MTTPTTDGLDQDQETLARFLESDASPRDCMGLSDLDGFLTGIAVSPEIIMPSEWLAEVWGGEEPTFVDRDEAETILGLIMVRYNEILRDLAAGKCGPIFWETEGGRVVASDWALGFAQAIKLREGAWAEWLEPGRENLLLLPILALCCDTDGRSLLGLTHDQENEMFERAPDLIPACVLAIEGYWRTRGRSAMSMPRAGWAVPKPVRAAAKIGRNDPCPCGSGKKFKRCCGQGGSTRPLAL